ncbi:uncharacterized protein [Fopius arisanus]|uniref:Ionotropic glutamate receptor C-terminal domain-containing protein n=1 Tax=Fopius arisanus TaxID=64838 RepID=A0A9R1TGN6_9HYME|nr:PREDICTED: uncharacterized protein LOC105270061 [Fopius arisanus]
MGINFNFRINLDESINHPEPLQNLLDHLLEQMTQSSKCIVFTIDPHYRKSIRFNWRINSLPYYSIYVRENEELSPPREKIKGILRKSKDDACDVYVFLIANGLQVSQLLEYAEKNRLINAQGNFLLVYDDLLFDGEMKYVWNRIINVVFIHRFSILVRKSDRISSKEWFNLETILYPVRAEDFVKTRYVNTWYKNRMINRDIDNPFTNETLRLEKKRLKVAVFEHIPAVTQYSRQFYKNPEGYSEKALGVEFEILRVLTEKLLFRPIFYRPDGIEIDKWGTKKENGSYNGLLGEAENGNAEFFLGDLQSTLRHSHLLELSYPYNSECLTFLTPESLTDNSWKLLISPFRLYTWISVILILLVVALAFHVFALFYQKEIMPHVKTGMTGINREMRGLSIFTDMQNSILYTYSMLLQVSLPRMPRPWALRVFIGWWLLYSILVTVAYRASMTATLANPVARITIDTLKQLARSKISLGGWSHEQREIFYSSLDPDLTEIGSRFELTHREDDAVARVANGTFGYYENIQTLQEARAKRQLLEEMQMKRSSRRDRVIGDRNLHIMSECVIYMPIAIGMDRNSPLKSRVDEILHGALVALGIGYSLGLLTLVIEIIHWKYFVMKNPAFDKYQMDIFYSIPRSNFINCK